MRLSRHFLLSEYTRSDTAARLGMDNTPDTPEHMAALTANALGMEQVRSLLGNRRITVTSGYRNRLVNEAVGGVKNSAHAKGWATDFTVEGMDPRDVAKEIAASHLAFDQLILETSRGICHISFDPRLRGEVKTQEGGPGSPVVWGIK